MVPGGEPIFPWILFAIPHRPMPDNFRPILLTFLPTLLGWATFFVPVVPGLAQRLSVSVPENRFIKTRRHDFGTVARGARSVHDFQIDNPFDQPLVIADVRSSCGCTRATVPQSTLPPGGRGVIRAEFNTRSFLGPKSATITVVISQPIRTEIQLQVSGNIRGDLVLEPGELVIPRIVQGETTSVSTEIHHAGNPDWKIVDVQSSLGFLVAELKELERRNGAVRYRLTITMQGNFPTGQIRDQLTLVTNDQRESRVPLSFLARVISPLSIAPEEIEFRSADARSGVPIRKRIIMKSDQPFRITKVATNDKRLQVEFGQVPRRTQLVTLTFHTIEGLAVPAEIPIRFETDLGAEYSRTINARISQ